MPQIDVVAQTQCNCSAMVRKIAAHNLCLENKVVDQEAVIQRRKLERKMTFKAHKADMQARDKREIGFVMLVALCITVFVVLALMTRGFV